MAEEKKEAQENKNYKLIIVAKDLPLIENYCRALTSKAKEAEAGVTISGVTRFPIKRLCITTRKSPCGNGSNTWDHYEMRMYKRSFNLSATQTGLQTLFKNAKNPPAVQITLHEEQ